MRNKEKNTKAGIFGRDYVVAAWTTGRIGSRQLCSWNLLAPFHSPVNVNSLGVWQIRCPVHVWWMTCLSVFPAFFIPWEISALMLPPGGRGLCAIRRLLKEGGRRFRELGCYQTLLRWTLSKRTGSLLSLFISVTSTGYYITSLFLCVLIFSQFYWLNDLFFL